MRIVNIYPVKNTQRIAEQPISMALTHLVEQSPYYASIFAEYSGYKILDNSIIELGEALTIPRIIKAAQTIKADEIILPDVLGDQKMTLLSVDKALGALIWQNALHKYKLMAVCQGRNPREIEECFRTYEANPHIDVIGIPKRVGDRVSLEYIWQDAKKPIHLLGLGTDFTELLRYRNPKKIRSCDTCLASLQAKFGNKYFAPRNPNEQIDLLNDYVTNKQFNALKRTKEDAIQCLARW